MKTGNKKEKQQDLGQLRAASPPRPSSPFREMKRGFAAAPLLPAEHRPRSGRRRAHPWAPVPAAPLGGLRAGTGSIPRQRLNNSGELSERNWIRCPGEGTEPEPRSVLRLSPVSLWGTPGPSSRAG